MLATWRPIPVPLTKQLPTAFLNVGRIRVILFSGENRNQGDVEKGRGEKRNGERRTYTSEIIIRKKKEE
jgi:hypothetical protein